MKVSEPAVGTPAEPQQSGKVGVLVGVGFPETAVPLCPQASGQVHAPADPPLRNPLHHLRLLPGGRHGGPAVF